MSHMALQYFALQACVLSWNAMNKHVFVPLCSLQPCDSCPCSLYIWLFQTSLLYRSMKCWFSRTLPLFSHMTWFKWGMIVTKSVFCLWKILLLSLVMVIVLVHWKEVIGHYQVCRWWHDVLGSCFMLDNYVGRVFIVGVHWMLVLD